ncbi:helix-turn-helix domain-containing protein [Tumebacillus lipolyticus]|uniref:Helix-turn-helix domain-containing protein n=1 Tax=Tumebacillus lipolyticus TaxID=1280370 RepID=A0ABW4ZZY5_9BACL
MGFPQRLKELRKSKKLSQESLGKEVGIDRTSISHYENSEENDERIPRLDTLKKLADFFDVTYDYLLGRTDAAEPSSLLKESKGRYQAGRVEQPSAADPVERFLLTLPDRLLQVPEQDRESLIQKLEETISDHIVKENETRP